MAKKSKCKLVIKGHHEILFQIQEMGGNVEKALVKAIETSGKNATTRYKNIIQEHHQSGITEESLIAEPKAVIEGNMITMNTGFDVSNGGAPAIWLDRGTPKQKPINFIRKIKKDKAVTGAIGYVLGEEWRKLIK